MQDASGVNPPSLHVTTIHSSRCVISPRDPAGFLHIHYTQRGATQVHPLSPTPGVCSWLTPMHNTPKGQLPSAPILNLKRRALCCSIKAVFTLVTRGRFLNVDVKVYIEPKGGILMSAQKVTSPHPM